MTKIKYIIIIVIGALLVIAGGFFIYLKFSVTVPVDEPSVVELWYIGDTCISPGFEELINGFRNDVGEKRKITLNIRSFEDENALLAELSDKSGLPDMVLCETELTSRIAELGVLSDVSGDFESAELEVYDTEMLASCTFRGKLYGIPLTAERDVLVMNTKLCGNAGSFKSFEALCIAAGDHYSENKSYYFTIADYSDFFNSAMAQLGEQFSPDNPFDYENDNVRYIYDHLATAAFKRGFTAVDGDPIQMVTESELACAMVSAVSAMEAEDIIDTSAISFMPCPPMENGDAVYTQRVTCISMLKTDDNSAHACMQFIKWLASEENVPQLSGESGLVPSVSPETEATDAVHSDCFKALMSAIGDVSIRTYEISPDYAEKSSEFNGIMDNIMRNSLK